MRARKITSAVPWRERAPGVPTAGRRWRASASGCARPDLEDELIRAAGVPAVEQVISSQGELKAFRTFQRQPAQQEVSVVAQLHRFMGTRSGRKRRYATLLALAIDLTAIPRPLDGVLASCGEAAVRAERYEPRG